MGIKIIIVVVFLNTHFLLSYYQDSEFEDIQYENSNYEKLESMTLEELMQVKIYSASKSDEKQYDAPSVTSVITRKQIINMGAENVEEILNYFPGFQSTRDIHRGNNKAISSRGKRSNQDSHDFLFLLDGIRLNNLSEGALQFVRRIPVDNIKQIEVIRGPGSALYGSNAYLGVINIVTDGTLNNASLKFGTNNSINSSVNISNDYDKLKYSLFISNNYTDGYHYNNLYTDTNSTKDPHSDFNIHSKLVWNDFTLNFFHFNRRDEDFYLFRHFGNDINEFNTSITGVKLNYIFELSPNFRNKIELQYKMVESDGLTLIKDSKSVVDDLQSKGITRGTESFFAGPVYSTRKFQANYSMEYDISESNKISFGAEYQMPDILKLRNKNNYELEDFINVLRKNRDEKIRYYGTIKETGVFAKEGIRHNYGFYIQDRHKFGELITLTAGGRFDYFQEVGSRFNPRFALNYKPFKESALKLLYEEAFRSPSIPELNTVISPVHYGNPDLNPEIIKTFESSYSQRIDIFSFGLTFFHNNVYNSIVQKVDTTDTNPLPTYLNGEKTEYHGLEFEFGIDITNNLFLLTNYSFIADLDEKSDFPSHLASFVLNYNLSKFNFNINGYYRSERYQPLMTELFRLDQYFIFNANIRYEFIKNIILEATVNNLIGDEIKTYDSGHGINGVPNPGRTFSIGLDYKFN